jgi:hypothetical protein
VQVDGIGVMEGPPARRTRFEAGSALASVANASRFVVVEVRILKI